MTAIVLSLVGSSPLLLAVAAQISSPDCVERLIDD
jgi:hypothetical protein